MTETFIRIAAGHYRNVGTGVEIVRVSADEAGQRGWHVTTPTVNGFEVVAIGATMREVKGTYVLLVREAYAAIEVAHEEAVAEDRLRVADMAADASMAVVRDIDHAEALAYAEVIHHVTRYSREISCGETGRVRVTEVAREVTCPACVAADDARRMAIAEEQAYADDRDRRDAEIEADEAWAASDTTWRQTTEQAHAEALAIDADRTNFLAEQGDAEDDDLIHLWPGDRSPSACGADIWTTPYTYGSPVLAEVTCDDCKGREQHRQFVARVREHRTANGGGLIENRRMVIDNDHAEALIAEQATRLTNAQAAQQAADELHDEELLMDAERTAERSSVFAAARLIGERVPTDARRAKCGCKPHPIFGHEDGCRYRGMGPVAANHRETFGSFGSFGGFREHGEPVWFEGRTWTVEHVAIGVTGYICLTLEVDDAAGSYEVRNVYADDVIADNHDEALREQAKRDAARIIVGARAPQGYEPETGDLVEIVRGEVVPVDPKPKWKVLAVDTAGRRVKVDLVRGSLLGPQWESWDSIVLVQRPGSIPEVPAELDDDAAWAAYCAALPQPTDKQIADVLAEYGDPYAALRAEVVGHYKDTARMAWAIRTREYDDTLKQDLLSQLRATMRTLRGVVETYDMLTESWRLSVRAGTERDAATQTF